VPVGLTYTGCPCDRLGDGQRTLLEYTLFEPAFYMTDVPGWGTAYAHCLSLGEKARVVIDTGHHTPGTNIEFIVAFLLRAGKLGGFDFDSRFYAEDDLMVGAPTRWVWTRTRSARTSAPATTTPSKRPASAARRPAGAPDTPRSGGGGGGDPLRSRRTGETASVNAE